VKHTTWYEHSLHTRTQLAQVIKTGPDVSAVDTHASTQAQFANAVTNLGRDTEHPEQNLSFLPQSLRENSGTASLPRPSPQQLLSHPVQLIIQKAYQRCIL
jgi:hypothetical protein